MNWPGQNRWLELLRAAGASGAASGWYERLARAYAEPHRHDHNRERIFATDWFHAKYEQRARRNLAASIVSLRTLNR